MLVVGIVVVRIHLALNRLNCFTVLVVLHFTIFFEVIYKLLLAVFVSFNESCVLKRATALKSWQSFITHNNEAFFAAGTWLELNVPMRCFICQTNGHNTHDE